MLNDSKYVKNTVLSVHSFQYQKFLRIFFLLLVFLVIDFFLLLMSRTIGSQLIKGFSRSKPVSRKMNPLYVYLSSTSSSSNYHSLNMFLSKLVLTLRQILILIIRLLNSINIIKLTRYHW